MAVARSCLLPLHFDPARLESDLERAGDATAWRTHYHGIHHDGGWSGIALRSVDGDASSLRVWSRRPYENTPTLEACAYFGEVLARFRCPVGAARLLRLRAGAAVKEHVDPGLGALFGELRVHVPIRTHHQVEFVLDGARVVMRPGEAWCLDTTYPHRVANWGDSDRVHLVLDCEINDWLRAMLPPALTATRGWRTLACYGLRKYRSLARDHLRRSRRSADAPS